jgi:smad nuclear-interacting protein 1
MAAPIVKPYILDLETTNGSFINGKKVEGARYYELIDKDVLRFGAS